MKLNFMSGDNGFEGKLQKLLFANLKIKICFLNVVELE